MLSRLRDLLRPRARLTAPCRAALLIGTNCIDGRVTASQIAAVGDDVNDLSMIKGAGLGAAMPNACETLAKFADHNIETSLADFINALIEGEFDK